MALACSLLLDGSSSSEGACLASPRAAVLGSSATDPRLAVGGSKRFCQTEQGRQPCMMVSDPGSRWRLLSAHHHTRVKVGSQVVHHLPQLQQNATPAPHVSFEWRPSPSHQQSDDSHSPWCSLAAQGRLSRRHCEPASAWHAHDTTRPLSHVPTAPTSSVSRPDGPERCWRSRRSVIGAGRAVALCWPAVAGSPPRTSTPC